MATEMVTGALVSAFVERTIDTLASRFVDIFRGRKHNKKQLSDLKMKLLAIDVVAFDAEQKQFTNPRVRDWLLRAKDAVLDAEDLLDEIECELPKSQVEAESQSAAKKVWNSVRSFVGFFENKIDSRMEQVIENLEHIATQSDLLGLKKGSGVGVGSGSGNLKHLRSLDLSYTRIENLPDSMALLYKLQILKLNNCERLKELPSCLLQLNKLCFLELLNTKVKNVHILGNLKNLQVLMNLFCVDIHEELSIQQLGQINIHGSLTISGLQNIENPSHASQACLENKPHLVELVLDWNWSNNSFADSSDSSSVIENLQPSKHLKKLSIRSHVGEQFPNWLLNNSLPNLVSLVLELCYSCKRLPPLGLLPFLKDLKIKSLYGIVSIDADFHGSNSSSFKSLETLHFSDMGEWEKWEWKAVTDAFPRLQHLYIHHCPKLKGQLPELLVPLENLHIEDCKELEAFAPRAVDLKLEYCEKVLFDWATVKSLKLAGYNIEASFMEMVTDIVPHNSIQHLQINDFDHHPCPNVSDFVSLWTFPLHFFPTLRTLTLLRLNNLQKISQNHIHNHLEDLTICCCPKIESISENWDMLKSLFIQDCPRLEPFTEGGLPSNLKKMTLSKCSTLVDSLKGALGDNPSLKILCVDRLDDECFPREDLLPLSLTDLAIYNFPNLEKLDFRLLNQLSSLKRLTLVNCPKLLPLPDEVFLNQYQILF
ncbi:hypothetical protein DEO72_LG3g227 [Vigna unguiculata]|uniref:Uncharacterized protein n=1 Tax=Vigna unguiculata TaxID=3917 RepID=A0A4D6LAW0_VIGUN|nr:hypothetical protein DEO72_LG3g227 [Vigna unguiculata]